jgi:hypothetical protein
MAGASRGKLLVTGRKAVPYPARSLKNDQKPAKPGRPGRSSHEGVSREGRGGGRAPGKTRHDIIHYTHGPRLPYQGSSAKCTNVPSGDIDDETDELTLVQRLDGRLRAGAMRWLQREEARSGTQLVERKEARRVKPWLSELDVPGGVAGAGEGPAGVEEDVEEHHDTRIACVVGTQDRRWIGERKSHARCHVDQPRNRIK